MWTNDLIQSDVPGMGVQVALGLAMILMFSLLTSCQESLPTQTASVQLKGSETLRPLLTMCAEDFMSRRPHIDILVQGGGSGMGIAALLHGMVDVAMASRELTAKERQYASQQRLQIQTFDIALDGIAVVVHPTNPVEALTVDDLRDIFTGLRRGWSDASEARHADDQLLPGWCHGLEKGVGGCLHRPVQSDLARLVKEAAGHGPSVQVDAPVHLVWPGVASHGGSASFVGRGLSASIPPCSAEEGASISIKRLQPTPYSLRFTPASGRG
jgi:hypothetical protein